MNKKIKEKIIRGIAASPGISIGTPFYYVHENLTVSRENISDNEIEIEIDKYKRALEKTKQQIIADKNKASKKSGSDASKIFDAHILIIEDQVLIEEIISFITVHNVLSSYAVSKVMRDYQTAFEKLENEYFSQRAFDIEDVTRRVLKNVLGDSPRTDQANILKGKKIVVANNIFPSDTLNFNKEMILGIVTEYGGKTSHAAILSRSLGIPAVVGASGITKWLNKTSLLIIDGYSGNVIINPGPSTFEQYKKRQHEEENQVIEDLKYSVLPSVTLDGTDIKIFSNIQSSAEAENVIKWNSDGVGLFRTEFLFKSSLEILSEDEQFKIYDDTAKIIYPRDMVIRLLDIGGDKLNEKISVKEANPFLGVRGMRLLFRNQDILKSHLRAILRASRRKNISIMIPFVANITEIQKTKNIIGKLKKELTDEGYVINENIKIGVMIEIPSIVMIADSVAKLVDYFSIGTNDLTQYLLAADRDNDKVGNIYDSFHPAVIKMIDMTVKAAKKADIPVSICGQMGGYPIAIPLLLGLGIREFSVTSFLIPVVKKIIRRLETKECEVIAQKCLKTGTSKSVNMILSDFFEKKIGENPLQ
jgi:phosphotransferase system enzyme I (PtsI)